jgi:hypothetical protein
MWYMGASCIQHLTFSVHFSFSILSGIARHGYFGILKMICRDFLAVEKLLFLVVLALVVMKPCGV